MMNIDAMVDCSIDKKLGQGAYIDVLHIWEHVNEAYCMPLKDA